MMTEDLKKMILAHQEEVSAGNRKDKVKIFVKHESDNLTTMQSNKIFYAEISTKMVKVMWKDLSRILTYFGIYSLVTMMMITLIPIFYIHVIPTCILTQSQLLTLIENTTSVVYGIFKIMTGVLGVKTIGIIGLYIRTNSKNINVNIKRDA